MIKTVLFDMGNVLVHFSHAKMCAQMGALCGKTEQEVRELLFESELQNRFESGLVSVADMHGQFETWSSRTLEVASLMRAGSDIFQLNAPVVPILDALKKSGRRLVLLSNTSIAHFEFVRSEFDVLDRFDDFVLSYEVGAMKPEPAIYEAALRKINCAPADCFYTDDIEKYVAQGRLHGLQAEVFTDADHLRRQLYSRGVEC